MDIKDYKFSNHLIDRLKQRDIKINWVLDTLLNPDLLEEIAEDEVHFYKIISESSNKCLKVVVNQLTKIIVTAHFDRNKTKKGLK